MKKLKLFSAALLALVIMSACAASPKSLTSADFSQSSYLKSPAEVASIMVDQKSAASLNVLDVRTPAEFQAECLKGAKIIDFEAVDFETKVGALDKKANYLVYCRTGRRSGLAVSKMREMGFTNIVEVKGGINAWKADGESVSQNCK